MTSEQKTQIRVRFGFATITAFLTALLQFLIFAWYLSGWQTGVTKDIQTNQAEIVRIQGKLLRVNKVFIPRTEYGNLVDRVDRVSAKQDRTYEILLEIRKDMNKR